jgi:hypothetical protein
MKYPVLALLVLCASALVAACQQAPASKPTIVISSPAHGARFRTGEVVAVNSAAADPGGIARIELYADGVLVEEATPPVSSQIQFNVIQNWTATTPGQHTLTVKAYNASNATAESGIVVTVTTSTALNTPTRTATTGGIASVTPLGGTAAATSTRATSDGTPQATDPPPATVCAPNLAFVADVTIPDGTVFQPGQAFTKTWRVQNSGNCAWAATDALAYVDGAALATVDSVPAPAIAPGQVADLSLPMRAPAQAGPYTSRWSMRAADGRTFGAVLTVAIVVQGPPTATRTLTTVPPTPTNTTVPPTATNTRPPPTPTPFFVDLPPFDGGQDIFVNVDDKEMSIEGAFTISEDTQIRQVDFFIFDGNGALIDTHTEQNEPYCYFQDTGGQCNEWDFVARGFRWPDGKAARDGLHYAQSVAYTTNGKARSDSRAFWLNLSGNSPQPSVFMNLLQAAPDDGGEEVQGTLVFEVEVDSESSVNIDRVEMAILKYNGTVVYQKRENNPPYCAFSDANGVCNRWVFAQHDYRWPSNVPLGISAYILRATAYSGNTPVAGFAQPMRIISLD